MKTFSGLFSWISFFLAILFAASTAHYYVAVFFSIVFACGWVFFGVKDWKKTKRFKWIKNTIPFGLLFLPISVFAIASDTLTIGDYMLGGLSINQLTAAYLFAFITLLLKWLIKTIDGVKKSQRTPEKFNFGFWLRDNALPKLASLMVNIITLFIYFRFAGELLAVELNMMIAVIVGLTLDHWVAKLKNMQPDVHLNKISERDIQ